MNEERLAELRRSLTSAYQEPEWGDINDMAHELFEYIERLRTRDEWLTVLLGRALAYVDEANMPASWELGDEIRLALSKEPTS